MTIAIPLVIIAGILAWVLRPRKTLTLQGRLTVLATVIPPAAVAIASVIFQLFHNAAGKTQVSDISNGLYIAGLCLVGIAIVVLAGLALGRKSELVKGTGFSICIAAVLYSAAFGLLEWLGGA